jgi:hypothetical protein
MLSWSRPGDAIGLDQFSAWYQVVGMWQRSQ